MNESSCDGYHMQLSVHLMSLGKSSRTGKLPDYNGKKTMAARAGRGFQVTEALSVSTGAVNYMSGCNYQS